MKLLLILPLLSISSFSTFAVECEAIKRYDDGQKLVTVSQKLVPVSGVAGKLEAEIQDAYYTFSKTDKNEYSAKIIMAPDYLSGFSAVANFDINGKFSLSKIDHSSKYSIECKK